MKDEYSVTCFVPGCPIPERKFPTPGEALDAATDHELLTHGDRNGAHEPIITDPNGKVLFEHGGGIASG